VTQLEALAARYRDFAEATSGQSACFEQWATEVAADERLLRWIGELPEPKQQPNLVFAAARWHGVVAPGPYGGLRDALLGDDGTIVSTILARSTQTNEVGRLATLMPAFAGLSTNGHALALLEVGASAGLCLYPDRYDYDWHPAGRLTGSGGPELHCDVAGAVPIPVSPLEVGWRGGIDLHPLDVTDEDAMAWLSTLVWPEQIARMERLATAIDLARAEPPELVAGDLLELLPERVEAAAVHGEVVVFHSAVIAYLDEQRRRAFAEMMRGLVDAGACRWVSNEDVRVLTEVSPTVPNPGRDDLAFVLAVDGRAVARTHQHGAAMQWL
jgi:hypothetical protein